MGKRIIIAYSCVQCTDYFFVLFERIPTLNSTCLKALIFFCVCDVRCMTVEKKIFPYSINHTGSGRYFVSEIQLPLTHIVEDCKKFTTKIILQSRVTD